MVRCSNGSNVSVLVNNSIVQEYGLEAKTEGVVNTYTCYIEAKEGDEFVVKASDISYPEPYSTSLYLKIDGQSVDGVSHCHFSPWNNTFAGYKVSQDAQILKCRAFTFGRMDLTSDDSVKKMPGAELDNVCTIRVDIAPKKRMGPINHITAAQLAYQLPSSSVQHEDSKPALWGISAKPGKELSASARTTTCQCKTWEDGTAQRHVVVFKYLSHEWLVSKGLKESLPEDDGIAIDSRRTERTAARRRARQEVDPITRNTRVKREGTAMSDAIVIKDEVVPRRTHMMDLTGNGDYVAAPRIIGEVIVIEDDEDNE